MLLDVDGSDCGEYYGCVGLQQGEDKECNLPRVVLVKKPNAVSFLAIRGKENEDK